MLVCIVQFEANSFNHIEKTRPAIEVTSGCFVPLSSQLGEGLILPKGEAGLTRAAQIVISQTQRIDNHQIKQELGYLSSDWARKVEQSIKHFFKIQKLEELFWQLPK